ncbi:LacI family transcriptional regulator, partial [Rhizobium leguminosarum]
DNGNVGFCQHAARARRVRTPSQGYRKFGYIGGTTARDTRGSQRRSGFQRTVEELGLGPGRMISFAVPPITKEQGGQAIVSLLERWPDT